MLEYAQAPILLTRASQEAIQPSHWGRVIYIDGEWARIAEHAQSAPITRVLPHNLAYVIYTSGSTGEPKGSMLLHEGLTNYLSYGSEAYLSAGVGMVPVNTTLAFDATVTSLWVPLLQGHTVLLLPGGEAELGALQAGLATQPGYALIKLTPAHLHLLSELDAHSKVAAQLMVIGGEALFASDVRGWQERAPRLRLINEYGPTETVVGCAVYEVNGTLREGGIPIGRPISNTRLYVLDEWLEQVPIGVSGELYIGGLGLARGYLKRAGLTAQRFIANPFGEAERLYRSGDLVRYRADGNLEFIGRRDDQVKVRGYRIELGEVESALLSHAGVSQAVVVARQEETGEKRLVGYVVGDDAIDVLQMREHLKSKLPIYMVPGALVQLERMPLSANGKIDRKALPAPEGRPEVAQYVEPRSEVEQALAAIWREVLRLDRVGIHDDFFELGGHSLLAMRVVAQVRESFAVEVELRAVFESPTISLLCNYIHNALWAISPRESLRPPSKGSDEGAI